MTPLLFRLDDTITLNSYLFEFFETVISVPTIYMQL